MGVQWLEDCENKSLSTNESNLAAIEYEFSIGFFKSSANIVLFNIVPEFFACDKMQIVTVTQVN